MKNKLFKMAMLLLLGTTITFAQNVDLDQKTATVKAKHKPKSLVLEQTLTILSDSLRTKGQFYLPKGKYIIYAMVDSKAIQKANFSISWDSMEGDTKDTSKRKIVKVGKGMKMKKFIVSNPEIVAENVIALEFKIDDIMNLLNNVNARLDAEKWANWTGTTQTYTKYKNGASSVVTFEVNKEDFKQEFGREVKILVYEN